MPYCSQRLLAVVVLLISLTVSLGAAAPKAGDAAPNATFYVATNGNDAWSGRLPAPNAEKTDGPLATLERARDAVRAVRPDAMVLPVPETRVLLRAGVYPRTQPLVFRPEDSRQGTTRVVYASYPGERAVISGGRAISGWKPAEGGLWKVDLPEVKAGKWYFRQLFVNGQPRSRPRFPKEGFFPVAGAPRIDTGGWVGVGPEVKSQWDLRTLRYRPGDLRKDWKNLDDVEVVVLQFWMESRLRIQNLDDKNHVVLFTGGSWRPLTWSGGYYAENVFEGLDTPGAWYLDRKQGTLYCRPLPGEDLAKAEVIAPVAQQSVRGPGSESAVERPRL